MNELFTPEETEILKVVLADLRTTIERQLQSIVVAQQDVERYVLTQDRVGMSALTTCLERLLVANDDARFGIAAAEVALNALMTE